MESVGAIDEARKRSTFADDNPLMGEVAAYLQGEGYGIGDHMGRHVSTPQGWQISVLDGDDRVGKILFYDEQEARVEIRDRGYTDELVDVAQYLENEYEMGVDVRIRSLDVWPDSEPVNLET